MAEQGGKPYYRVCETVTSQGHDITLPGIWTLQGAKDEIKRLRDHEAKQAAEARKARKGRKVAAL